MPRQHEPGKRALTQRDVEMQAAAGLLGKARDHGETKAGAGVLAVALDAGSEERLRGPRGHLGRHAVAGFDDAEIDGVGLVGAGRPGRRG